MNKKFIVYLFLAFLLVGSFLGSYCNRHSVLGNKVDAVTQAKRLIDESAGDQMKLAQASDLLRQELLLNPDNVYALFLEGRALQQRGMIDAALNSYKKYFNQKISIDFAANYNAGELSELKGDLPSTEKYFIASINSAPQEGNGWERLIRFLLKQNRNQDAKAYFNALQKQLPDSEATKRLASIMPQ